MVVADDDGVTGDDRCGTVLDDGMMPCCIVSL